MAERTEELGMDSSARLTLGTVARPYKVLLLSQYNRSTSMIEVLSRFKFLIRDCELSDLHQPFVLPTWNIAVTNGLGFCRAELLEATIEFVERQGY